MTSAQPELLQAAAAIYRLAARTFAAEVDSLFYRSLLDLRREPELAPLDELLPVAPEPVVLDELAVEYCRLFIGPRPACPPYAGAYTGRATLGLPAKQTIRAFIDEHGITLRVPAGAPIAEDDHAAIGLAALAALCTTAATSSSTATGRAALTGCARLRDTYLAGWLPRFLTDVRQHSRLGPYGPVARITEALLRDGTVCPTGEP